MNVFRKSPLVLLLILFFAGAVVPVSAYRLVYREQLYQLYRRQMYQTPTRIAENIYWLEQALASDFANPLYALARISDNREWEWYRYLFTMHINLLLVEQYLQWSNQFMKHEAFFYNAPWQRQNLESLDRAEELLEFARVHWREAERWSQAAMPMRFINLEGIQYWEDQHHRIRSGDLNYDRIIDRHLDRLVEVRGVFERMGPDTY